MHPLHFLAAVGFLIATVVPLVESARLQSTQSPPLEWVEPETGHRVIRLSRESGSASLYFHQNPYTANGDKFVFTTRGGLSFINLETREIETIVNGRAGQIVVGRKTRQVFYTREGIVYATHLDTRETRQITKLPVEIRGGSGLAVNSNETLLAGSFVEGGGLSTENRPPDTPRPGAVPGEIPPNQESSLEARWARRLPMRLYTVNIKTGEVKTFHPSPDWLNHIQFSPTDPTLIMFCHEGPWHKVDRIWTIRTDGTGLQKIHTRTMDMEIAGHEFFSADGRIIWYDLQTPKYKVFWLAGHVLTTARRSNTKSNGNTGRSISTRLLMESSFVETEAGHRVWQLQAMDNGFICSRQVMELSKQRDW